MPPDPLEAGAYLTDGERLLQVIVADEVSVLLEDSRTERVVELTIPQMLAAGFRRVETQHVQSLPLC